MQFGSRSISATPRVSIRSAADNRQLNPARSRICPVSGNGQGCLRLVKPGSPPASVSLETSAIGECKHHGSNRALIIQDWISRRNLNRSTSTVGCDTQGPDRRNGVAVIQPWFRTSRTARSLESAGGTRSHLALTAWPTAASTRTNSASGS